PGEEVPADCVLIPDDMVRKINANRSIGESSAALCNPPASSSSAAALFPSRTSPPKSNSGVCVQTASLDGETNFKRKKVMGIGVASRMTPRAFVDWQGQHQDSAPSCASSSGRRAQPITVELQVPREPNADLNSFTGTCSTRYGTVPSGESVTVPLTIDNLLLRGTTLRQEVATSSGKHNVRKTSVQNRRTTTNNLAQNYRRTVAVGSLRGRATAADPYSRAASPSSPFRLSHTVATDASHARTQEMPLCPSPDVCTSHDLDSRRASPNLDDLTESQALIAHHISDKTAITVNDAETIVPSHEDYDPHRRTISGGRRTSPSGRNEDSRTTQNYHQQR
ncbi:unnamed protein product, partial [Amoebophrya sp. A120]